MAKEPGTGGLSGGRKAPAAAAQDKKKRLAEALRSNLLKRKDKKAESPGGKPGRD